MSGSNRILEVEEVIAANNVDSRWFAAWPSGTENVCKICAESFKNQSHLNVIISEAQEIVSNALGQP